MNTRPAIVDLAVGSDLIGDSLLEELLESLKEGIQVIDLRAHVVRGEGYAPIARAVASFIRDGKARRGLLVCGTGIGVSIAANRITGVRAAICHDPYSMQRSILSNNCQVACFGSRVIAPKNALILFHNWLQLTYDPHTDYAIKLAEIDNLEMP